MSVMKTIWDKARSASKTIALPEGSERRTLLAAQIIKKEKLANVILLGNEDTIRKEADKSNADISGIDIINPDKSDKIELYAEKYFELRKSKGVTFEDAYNTMKDTIYFGTMMVKRGDADGLVSGAIHSTGDLLRPGFQIVKTAPGISIVSSCFIMEIPDCEYGEKGMLLLADCAINPNPNEEELASIAVSTATTAKALLNIEPKIAMLSFSTKGSAKHELVDKVVKATEIVRKKAPFLQIDGELQLDAAIIPEVGKLKAKNSTVAGNANILIFPDLQAGNIGYKLVQRLAKANTIGPISQGFALPINDLSRGCVPNEIVDVVAITAVQAIN
ncbi:MAG: phosphate acetyltransferase [Ignavibacteria bacterium]|nr:phosphate acetyltransferase [Ignavibacteria bacterium]